MHKKLVALIGASPDTVTLKWNGPSGGTMLQPMGTAYSKIQRITFDGNGGRAGVCLWNQWDASGGYFPTTWNLSDLVFTGCGWGFKGGDTDTDHQDTTSEVTINRSKFMNNTEGGILTNDWNTLDIWVRNSLFQNQPVGVQSNMGNFTVYDSVFMNSSDVDFYVVNGAPIAVRGCFSQGSKYFYYHEGPTSAPQQTTFQDNVILSPTYNSIYFAAPGPLFLIDNVFRNTTGNTSPAVVMNGNGLGNLFAIGNRGTVSGFVSSGANSSLYESASSVISYAAASLPQPQLPGTPPKAQGTVFEVTAFTGAAIQAALNQAASLVGNRPIVHLPGGNYSVSQTITIPAGSDVRLIGDQGALAEGGGASQLNWTGGSNGVVLQVNGPTQVRLQDFSVTGAGNAKGLVVSNVDQVGGRVLCDQCKTHASDSLGVGVSGLNNAKVEFTSVLSGGTNAMQVIGGSQPAAAVVHISSGTGNSESGGLWMDIQNGGSVVVRDYWSESSSNPTNFNLNNTSGNLTLDNLKQGWTGSSIFTTHTINNFAGTVSMFGVGMGNTSVQMQISGTSAAQKVFLAGLSFREELSGTVALSDTSSNRARLWGNVLNTGTAVRMSDNGVFANEIGTAAQSLRSVKRIDRRIAVPAGATDLVIQGFAAEDCLTGIQITQ